MILFRIFLLYCLTIFTLPQVLAHQTVKGTITDMRTQSPLYGATVKGKNSPIGTLTDHQGRFELSLPDSIRILQVSYVGYEVREIEVHAFSQTSIEPIAISLNPAPIDLEAVEIVAHPQNASHTVSAVDIHLRPLNSSQDILRQIPGLFIAQHGGGGKAEQIFLRGFDIDHGTDIQIQVDGMPVNMVSHAHGQGYADLHFVIPELIQTIDFDKGPYSPSHGNFNTAGYVDFHTRSQLEESPGKRGNWSVQYVSGIGHGKCIRQTGKRERTPCLLRFRMADE